MHGEGGGGGDASEGIATVRAVWQKCFLPKCHSKEKRGGESPPHNSADMRKYVRALQQTALIRDKFNNMQASFFLHTTVSKIHPEACQVRHAMKIPARFTASVLLFAVYKPE